MTGTFKDIVRSIKDEPWIPTDKSRKGDNRAAARSTAAFCEGKSKRPCVTVCQPRGACSCDCASTRAALVEELARRRLDVTVGNVRVGCSGSCKAGPFIGFPQKGFFYTHATPESVAEIVETTLVQGKVLAKYLSVNPDRSYRSDFYFEKDTGLLATIDESVSIVEVAKYFLEFERGLSCGKCIPCRIGLQRMLEGLERIVSGEGTTIDLEEIEKLCQTMIDAPYCEFAAASSGPVYSALKYFRDDFKAVVKEVERPAAEPVVKKERPAKQAKPVEPVVEEAPSVAPPEPVAVQPAETGIPTEPEERIEAQTVETAATVEEPSLEPTAELTAEQAAPVDVSPESKVEVTGTLPEADSIVAVEEEPVVEVAPVAVEKPVALEASAGAEKFAPADEAPAVEEAAVEEVSQPKDVAVPVEVETPSETVTEAIPEVIEAAVEELAAEPGEVPAVEEASVEEQPPVPAPEAKPAKATKTKAAKAPKAPKAQKEKTGTKKKKGTGSAKSKKK